MCRILIIVRKVTKKIACVQIHHAIFGQYMLYNICCSSDDYLFNSSKARLSSWS